MNFYFSKYGIICVHRFQILITFIAKFYCAKCGYEFYIFGSSGTHFIYIKRTKVIAKLRFNFLFLLINIYMITENICQIVF